jgi:hypothetical protein
VGKEPLVEVHVETIETIIEDTCLKRYKIFAFHFSSFSKDFMDGIQSIKGVMLKGWDEHVI